MSNAFRSMRGRRLAAAAGYLALLLLILAGARYGVAQDATPVTGSPVASPMASPMASPVAAAPVTLEAVDIAWNQTQLTVAVGGTITLVNLGQSPHTFVIEGYNDAAPVDIPVGGQPVPWTVPPDLAPGTYTYICNVPGHQQVMRGTLTVTG